MRAVRRFAVSVMVSHGLIRPTGQRLAARRLAAGRLAARGLQARGVAVLRAAALAVIALIAGTPAVLAAGTAPALATAANAPRSTLASVIPSTAVPRGRVTFAVYCSSTGATSATLHGRTLGLTRHITMRPNTAAGDFIVSVSLPGSIRPGTYHPRIECSDGTSTTARLLIPAFGAAGGTPGGAVTWLALGGLILVGMGTVAGAIALRRRHAGRSDQSDESEHLDDLSHVRHSDDFSGRF